MPMSQDESKYQPNEPRKPEDVARELGPDVVVSADTRRENRIPPGQARTRKWPVLHYGRVPTVDTAAWTFEVFGLVETPLSFTWGEFQALPRVKVFSDFHCVTRWSRLDNVWEGVSVAELLRRAGVKPGVKYVIAHGYDDGFTTNMPFADFAGEDCLVADLHDGEPLTADHGGPARLIVPKLYAWKSCKWLRALELAPVDRPGLWERNGYHNHGDPWPGDQRYSW
ncbi:MAG: sulfite oxidase-like oxidoreductase [Planctomycetia bacterium]